MKIYRNFEQIEGNFAVCIGVFDGVHKGHQFLLSHLRDEACLRGLQPAVVTFENHPRTLVQPDFQVRMIDSLDERLEKLDRMGLDACFVLKFTEDVRRLTAREFIEGVLCRQLHVRMLIIGYDHRFGRDRSEGFEQYVEYGRQCGMEVIQEPVFNDNSGLNYSSSEVRRALNDGDIVKAEKIMGW